MSLTVMLKVQDELKPLGFVAVQLTRLTPTGKVVAGKRGQLTVVILLLSVAVARFHNTTAVATPGSVDVVTLLWHVILGGVRSATVTRKVQFAVFDDASFA